MVTQQKPEAITSKGTGLVLLTLASAQFLMTLDSSVMNVSIATVAKDVGTTVTGIQTAITLYTLVMATLMLTGGKIGAIIGRRRAFSIVLELSVVETGIRIIPLSLALLVSAIAVPRLWPNASPRRVGLLLLLSATVLLIAVLDADATASVITIPLILIGLGIGALASQLGAVTVSSVPDKESSEVGGLQNTSLNLGASLGTALVGSVLTTLVLQGVLAHPSIPESLKADAQTTFGAGVPFVSDTAVRTGLEAYGATQATIQEVLQLNADAHLAALRTALFVVVLAATLALYFTRWVPTRPPGAPAEVPEEEEA